MNILIFWYGDLSRNILLICRYWLVKISDTFSIPILLRTLFAPWKRDIYRTKSMALNLVIQAALFNLFSRAIGAIIKISVLFFALMIFLITFTLEAILIICWLFMPVIIFGTLVLGLNFIIRG